MLINFIAASMHSGVLIICFRKFWKFELRGNKSYLYGLGRSECRTEDKRNAYFSKGIWSAQKHKTRGASGLRKTI